MAHSADAPGEDGVLAVAHAQGQDRGLREAADGHSLPSPSRGGVDADRSQQRDGKQRQARLRGPPAGTRFTSRPGRARPGSQAVRRWTGCSSGQGQPACPASGADRTRRTASTGKQDLDHGPLVGDPEVREAPAARLTTLCRTRTWDGACVRPALHTVVAGPRRAHDRSSTTRRSTACPIEPPASTDADAGRGGPWLVSFVCRTPTCCSTSTPTTSRWRHCGRGRARTQLLLGGLLRWGYITLTPPAGRPLRKPPQDDATVRARRGGLRAREVWTPLPAIIDDRWRRRLGAPAFDRLDRALRGCLRRGLHRPAGVPPGDPSHAGRQGRRTPAVRRHGWCRTSRSQRAVPSRRSSAGSCTPSRVDFEAEARIAPTISANTLRVLDVAGTRARRFPRLTGVSREGNAMCAGWLERHGCAALEAGHRRRAGAR